LSDQQAVDRVFVDLGKFLNRNSMFAGDGKFGVTVLQQIATEFAWVEQKVLAPK